VVTINNKALKFGSCQVGNIYIILKMFLNYRSNEPPISKISL